MTFNPKLATFSFFLFIAGVVLTVLTVDAQKKLSISCANSEVQNGLNFLLMLSVIMMTIPIMQLFCHWACGCPQNDLPYKGLVIFISILMIVGSSIVINGLNKDKHKCTSTGSNTKNYAIGVLTFNVVLIFIFILTYTKPWKKFMHGGGGKNEELVEMVSL